MTLHKRLKRLNQGQLATVLGGGLRIDPFKDTIDPSNGTTDADLYKSVEWLRKRIMDAVKDGTVTEGALNDSIDRVFAPPSNSEQRRLRFLATLGLQDAPR